MAQAGAAPAAVHDVKAKKFVIAGAAGSVFIEYSRDKAGAMSLDHTFTDEAMRGKGLAAVVTDAAFKYAEANGMKVVPKCSYVSDTFLPKHPEYAGLVAKY